MMNDENETIYVYGILAKQKARIVITSPQLGDKEYAENIVKIWNKHTAFPLKGNMEIEIIYGEIENIIIDYNKLFIKITDPSPEDIKYTKMLLVNWNNYYKPENYLLPNTEIIQPGD